MRRALVAVALLLALPATAAAESFEESATGDGITATVTYDQAKEFSPATNLKLAVTAGDKVLAEKTFEDDAYLMPVKEDFFDGKAVGVTDLDGDGEPEAVFDFFTGGAHCCVVSYVYDGGAELLKHNWQSAGYTLETDGVDGNPQFVSSDERMAALFSSYASSLRPLRVLQLKDGEFVDVTRDKSFRPRIVRERKQFKRLYRKGVSLTKKDPFYREVVQSAIGAITADDCLLGDCAPGYAMASKALSANLVYKTFPKLLRTKLRRFGYDN